MALVTDNKKTALRHYDVAPTDQNQVAYVTTDGKLNYSSTVGQAQLASLEGATSNHQDDIDELKTIVIQDSERFTRVFHCQYVSYAGITLAFDSGSTIRISVYSDTNTATVNIFNNTSGVTHRVSESRFRQSGATHGITTIGSNTNRNYVLYKATADSYDIVDALISETGQTRRTYRVRFHMHNNDADEWTLHLDVDFTQSPRN